MSQKAWVLLHCASKLCLASLRRENRAPLRNLRLAQHFTTGGTAEHRSLADRRRLGTDSTGLQDLRRDEVHGVGSHLRHARKSKTFGTLYLLDNHPVPLVIPKFGNVSFCLMLSVVQTPVDGKQRTCKSKGWISGGDIGISRNVYCSAHPLIRFAALHVLRRQEQQALRPRRPGCHGGSA